ncbi:hypothetical protein B0H21DRAFT_713078 [Amylocystis lapponica]|nr:hypothetical protein B0H21DRAFT_713078 [Amylocystis lapponica]
MAGAKRVLSSPDSSDREDSRGPVKHSKNTSHDNEAVYYQRSDMTTTKPLNSAKLSASEQLAKYERQHHKVNAAGHSTTSEAPFSFDGMPPESEDGSESDGMQSANLHSAKELHPRLWTLAPSPHATVTGVNLKISPGTDLDSGTMQRSSHDQNINKWALLGPPPHAAPPTSNTQLDAEQQATWAQEAWNTACQARNGTHTYELTERMMTIIKARKSNTRSDIIKAVRPIVQQTYGFVNTGDKKSDQARENIRIYLRLMDDSMFLYKDNGDTSGERSGYAEHPIVSKLIYTCFFTDKNAVGIQYPRHFDPIGLTTLALIFAAIEHSIEEWSSGVQFKVAFREEDTKTTFQSYRKGLQNWEALDEGITRKIRKKWHDRARRASGAPTNMESITSNISSAALEQAKKHLQGRSGETDSEAE